MNNSDSNIEYEPISYIVQVFAAKFAIAYCFVFVLPLLCCCCCLSHRSKRNKHDNDERRFDIVKYNDLYESDVDELRSTIKSKKSGKGQNQTSKRSLLRRIFCCKSKKAQSNVEYGTVSVVTDDINNNDNSNNGNQDQDHEKEKGKESTEKMYIYYVFDTMDNTKFTTLLNTVDKSDKVFENFETFVNVIIKTYDPTEVEIILQIESPGGIAYKFELAYDNLTRLRNKGFFITAVTDTYCASGGYMLACACNKIVCAENAKIGSVGVALQLYNYSKLADKVGVEDITFTTGQYKRPFPTGSSYTEADTKRINDMVDETFETFKRIVKTGRKLTDEQMGPIIEARVYPGSIALHNNMVDEICLSSTYIDRISEDHDIYMLVNVNNKRGMIGGLLGNILTSTTIPTLNTVVNFVKQLTADNIIPPIFT